MNTLHSSNNDDLRPLTKYFRILSFACHVNVSSFIGRNGTLFADYYAKFWTNHFWLQTRVSNLSMFIYMEGMHFFFRNVGFHNIYWKNKKNPHFGLSLVEVYMSNLVVLWGWLTGHLFPGQVWHLLFVRHALWHAYWRIQYNIWLHSLFAPFRRVDIRVKDNGHIKLRLLKQTTAPHGEL